MSHRFLRLKQLKALTGLSRSTTYLKISENSFPLPVKLGTKAVGWVEREVEDWINLQIELSSKRLGDEYYA